MKIMLEKNLKSYSTDLIENPKELFGEVLGIQFNIEKIPWVNVNYDYARQADVDIDILRSKLGCIVLPYFLLVEEIKNRNEKLAEKALSELSNNIIKLLNRESYIFEKGTGYLITRLHLDNALPSCQYNARGRTYSISLFKAFIVNLIEKAPKEKQKDKEERELKNIEFRKNQEDLDITADVLKNKDSNARLAVQNIYSKKWEVPYVIEPSAGVDRGVLAILNESYKEETLENGKNRVVLALKPHLSPIKAAVIPIKKNDSTIVDFSKKIKDSLQKLGLGRVVLENTGNIGKSYRKHDEIGTPICITIDYETLEDSTVTVRDRDTMEQKRVKVETLDNLMKNLLVK